jgi:hypothetical protein
LDINKYKDRLEQVIARQAEIVAEVDKLDLEYDQLKEDEELLVNILMHQDNKKSRIKELMDDGFR